MVEGVPKTTAAAAPEDTSGFHNLFSKKSRREEHGSEDSAWRKTVLAEPLTMVTKAEPLGTREKRRLAITAAEAARDWMR